MSDLTASARLQELAKTALLQWDMNQDENRRLEVEKARRWTSRLHSTAAPPRARGDSPCRGRHLVENVVRLTPGGRTVLWSFASTVALSSCSSSRRCGLRWCSVCSAHSRASCTTCRDEYMAQVPEEPSKLVGICGGAPRAPSTHLDLVMAAMITTAGSTPRRIHSRWWPRAG